MMTHLERIMSRTSAKLVERKQRTSLSDLERRAEDHQPRGFAAALKRVAESGPAIIAELKKASPSKGVLREDYQPAVTAPAYQQAGAAAISVLTDEEFFQGSLDDLVQVAKAVSLPVLRKDFILDPFQILEARAAGADAVLLIVAAHSDEILEALHAAAQALHLDVLCEVHDWEELQRATDLGFETIGVNCRDLKTLAVNPDRHLELAETMPAHGLRVAESGIRDGEDIRRLRDAGYQAFLIGEALMREQDPGAALAALIAQSVATPAAAV